MREGKLVLLLSDRYLVKGKLPIHALLATGAVHHRLVAHRPALQVQHPGGDRHRARCASFRLPDRLRRHRRVSLSWPIRRLFDMMRKGALKLDGDARQELGRSYRRGIRKGLFKIMSKMGISTIASYRSAQLFEIVGPERRGRATCASPAPTAAFRARISRTSKADAEYLAKRAWNPREPVEQGGLLKYMHGGEYHMYNPDVVATLQAAVMSGDYEQYRQFARTGQRAAGVLPPRSAEAEARPRRRFRIEEVEPVEAILARFDGAGMSLGALSPEAHEALAIAMNRLGGALQLRRGRRGSARATAPRRIPRSSRWPPAASASRRNI